MLGLISVKLMWIEHFRLLLFFFFKNLIVNIVNNKFKNEFNIIFTTSIFLEIITKKQQDCKFVYVFVCFYLCILVCVHINLRTICDRSHLIFEETHVRLQEWLF